MIGTDKFKHFIVSFAICFLMTILVGVIWGAILTIVIGCLKELYDSRQPNNKYDWNDILADILGITLFLSIFNL